jgi:hypothetical protein
MGVLGPPVQWSTLSRCLKVSVTNYEATPWATLLLLFFSLLDPNNFINTSSLTAFIALFLYFIATLICLLGGYELPGCPYVMSWTARPPTSRVRLAKNRPAETSDNIPHHILRMTARLSWLSDRLAVVFRTRTVKHSASNNQPNNTDCHCVFRSRTLSHVTSYIHVTSNSNVTIQTTKPSLLSKIILMRLLERQMKWFHEAVMRQIVCWTTVGSCKADD